MRYDRSVYKAFTFFSQFTINMLVPILMCSVVGYALDEWLGTSFLFVLLFFVGALAGIRNIFILARRVYDDRQKQEKLSWDSLKKDRKGDSADEDTHEDRR